MVREITLTTDVEVNMKKIKKHESFPGWDKCTVKYRSLVLKLIYHHECVSFLLHLQMMCLVPIPELYHGYRDNTLTILCHLRTEDLI